eukprot:scaffold28967_cov66-Phaeocystis_antarctica.AAC.3
MDIILQSRRRATIATCRLLVPSRAPPLSSPSRPAPRVSGLADGQRAAPPPRRPAKGWACRTLGSNGAHTPQRPLPSPQAQARLYCACCYGCSRSRACGEATPAAGQRRPAFASGCHSCRTDQPPCRTIAACTRRRQAGPRRSSVAVRQLKSPNGEVIVESENHLSSFDRLAARDAFGAPPKPLDTMRSDDRPFEALKSDDWRPLWTMVRFLVAGSSPSSRPRKLRALVPLACFAPAMSRNVAPKSSSATGRSRLELRLMPGPAQTSGTLSEPCHGNSFPMARWSFSISPWSLQTHTIMSCASPVEVLDLRRIVGARVAGRVDRGRPFEPIHRSGHRTGDVEGVVRSRERHPQEPRLVCGRVLQKLHRLIRCPVVLIHGLRVGLAVLAKLRVAAGEVEARCIHIERVVAIDGSGRQEVAERIAGLRESMEHIPLAQTAPRVREAKMVGIVRALRVEVVSSERRAKPRLLCQIVLAGDHRVVASVLQRGKVRRMLVHGVVALEIVRYACVIVLPQRCKAGARRRAHWRRDGGALREAGSEALQARQVRHTQLRLVCAIPVPSPLVGHEQKDVWLRAMLGRVAAQRSRLKRGHGSGSRIQRRRATETSSARSQTQRPKEATKNLGRVTTETREEGPPPPPDQPRAEAQPCAHLRRGGGGAAAVSLTGREPAALRLTARPWPRPARRSGGGGGGEPHRTRAGRASAHRAALAVATAAQRAPAGRPWALPARQHHLTSHWPKRSRPARRSGGCGGRDLQGTQAGRASAHRAALAVATAAQRAPAGWPWTLPARQHHLTSHWPKRSRPARRSGGCGGRDLQGTQAGRASARRMALAVATGARRAPAGRPWTLPARHRHLTTLGPKRSRPARRLGGGGGRDLQGTRGGRASARRKALAVATGAQRAPAGLPWTLPARHRHLTSR